MLVEVIQTQDVDQIVSLAAKLQLLGNLMLTLIVEGRIVQINVLYGLRTGQVGSGGRRTKSPTSGPNC